MANDLSATARQEEAESSRLATARKNNLSLSHLVSGVSFAFALLAFTLAVVWPKPRRSI